MKNWLNRLAACTFSLFLLSGMALAADPDFSSLGAVSDNANDTTLATDGDTVTFTLTINVAEDSDGTGQVTFDVGAATGLTATFPVAGASTTHTATYAVPAGQDGPISVTNITFTNTSAENLTNTPAFPHTPTPNVTLDNTDPRVTSIVRQTPASSPTNADSLTWRVTFDEDVSNVDTTDFSVAGTTGTVSGVVVQTANTVFDVTVSGGDLATLDGTVTLSFAGGQNVTDTAGNSLTNTTPTGANDDNYVVDNTDPRVTSIVRQTPASSPTNADSLTWRVTFDEDVANIDTTDFSVAGTTGTVSNVSVQTANTVFDVTVSGGDLAALNATVTLSFAGGQNVTDTAGNSLTNTTPTGTNDDNYVVDNTAPTVTENTAVTDPTNDNTPDVIINTDEVGTLTMGGSCGTSTSTTIGSTGNTTLVLTQPDNTTPLADLTFADCTVQITDSAGNANAPTALTSFRVDTTAPRITSIVRQVPASSPTNADSLTWRVTFDEDVANVDATDFSVAGTTATVTGVAVQTANTVFDVTVSGGDLAALNATVTLSFAGGQNITDVATNALVNLTPTGTNDDNYVVDNTAPTVTETTPVTDPTMDTTPDVVINTDEVGTLTMGGSCGTSTSTTIGSTGNTTLTLTDTDNVSPLPAATYSDCTVQITDAAGNANAPTALTTFRVDDGAPEITSIVRQTPATSPTNADTLTWRITFTEDVQNVDTTDFTITGSTATVTGVAVQTANTVFDITASGGDLAALNATVTLGFAGGQNIQDLAANALVNLTPIGANDNTYVVDNTAPTVTENTAVPNPTNDSTPDVTINTDEAGTLAVTGACGTSSSTALGSGNTAITLTQPDNTTPLADNPGSTYACSVEVTDAAGNSNGAVALTAFEVDTVAPTLVQITPVPDPTTDNTPDYTFSSDEISTISYGGNCSSVTTAATVGNNTVTFNVLPDAIHSNCTVQTTDAAGNPSNLLNLPAFRVDTQAPSVQSAVISTSGNPGFARAGQTVTFDVTFNEAVTVTAVNTASDGTNISTVTTEFDAVTSATDQLVFTVQALENGTVTPVVDFNIQDAAGLSTNITSLGVITGGPIEADTQAPSLNPVSIASNNADPSLAVSGDTVTVSFTADEPVTAVSGTIFTEAAAAANVGGNDFTLTLLTNGDEAEGLAPFTADFEDLAGNAGTQVTAVTDASSVTFDNTPAAISSVSITSGHTFVADSPTFYANDNSQTITVTIDPTEPIQAPTGTILGLAPVFTNTVGDIWTATVTTTGGHTEGVVTFSLDVQDLAGAGAPINVSATTDGSSVIYDETAPTNPTTVLDAQGAPIAGPKPSTSAIFNWTGDADALAGVAQFEVRFENATAGISETGTVVLPTRDFTPAAVISDPNPYNFHINTVDKAGNQAGEALLYSQEYSGLLRGTVTDKDTGLPIEGAVVQLIAKFGEQCAPGQEVCTTQTDSNGQYQMGLFPNQEYRIDFLKLPQFEIAKQGFTAGIGDIQANAQLVALEDGKTQTGNQSVTFTATKTDGSNETVIITVHSFSGEATAVDVTNDLKITSFARINLVEVSDESVTIDTNGNNEFFVRGVRLNGVQTGKSQSVQRVTGGSSGGGFSGISRATNALKGRILTPEESMEFVKTLNQGVAGETLYYTNRNGKKVFAGYVKGRLSMIVFQRHSKVPIVYRGYRRSRQGYDSDQASVRQNQIAINEAYNKNKMLKKKVPKSVAVGNRYESLKRKLAHRGQTMTRLVNRKQSSTEVAAAVRRRNIMVANKTNPYERHNGFTQKESRIAMAEREKQVDRLRIIKSSQAVASMLNVIKNAPLEASVVDIKDLGATPVSVRRR